MCINRDVMFLLLFFSFWIAIEKLRLSKEDDVLRENAKEIFQEFVTPSGAHVIKFQSSLVRGMEEFVYGGFHIYCVCNCQFIIRSKPLITSMSI